MTAYHDRDPTQLLRAAGLRVTKPRLAVLSVLIEHPHSDTDTVLRLARAITSLSTQAGYDVLSALTRAGLARRVEPAGHLALFEARVADNHHHVVCRGCGRIEDIDCVVGAAPCLAPSDAHGFVLDEAEVTFWGRCAACNESANYEQPPRIGAEIEKGLAAP